MGQTHTKFLLVEGKDDAYAVQGLMSHFVHWGSHESDWPVRIDAAGSDTELLKPSYLRNTFRRAGLEAVGVMVDANGQFDSRWASLRNTCTAFFPDFPEGPPAEGLVIPREDGLRLGVWIMPNNRSAGMLETFLSYLVPPEGARLWQYAQDTCDAAREHGAPYKQAHLDKARVHTYLAWQDPPGRPFGEALKARCLSPGSPAAEGFVKWFLRLYGLPRKATA
ncbi:MAG TPA: DUF3226 domain-containing protein [Phycisphaerae bacterium]|nr:DUF3226 domain-containing protein [Phycisphaerae bacterium]